jgi:hypothetical protein
LSRASMSCKIATIETSVAGTSPAKTGGAINA